MKAIKTAVNISMLFSLLSCGSYTMSTFYVKNTSDKPVNFNATVIKYSQTGPFLMNVPFVVMPKDSVLARRVKLKSGLTPENWFTEFKIFPTDGLEFNDPKEPRNWVKSMGNDGNPVYTFEIVK